jgi:hypothetical protein
MTAPIDALQQALAAEHAAVYGYGVAGAHLSGAAVRAARAAIDVHRARRDRLRTLVVDARAEPAEAAAAYRLPLPVTDAASARRLAALIERDIAVVYGVLVAAARGGDREFAARSLQDAAVRAAAWGAEPAAFPGYPVGGEPTPIGTPAG